MGVCGSGLAKNRVGSESISGGDNKQEENRDLKETVNKLKAENKDLEEEKEKAVKNLKSKLNDLEEQIEKEEKRIKKLKTEIEDLEQKNRDINTEWKNERGTLDNEIKILKSELFELKKFEGEKQDKIKRLKSKMKEIEYDAKVGKAVTGAVNGTLNRLPFGAAPVIKAAWSYLEPYVIG